MPLFATTTSPYRGATLEEFLKDKTVVYERKILTKELEDASDWWNGVYIVVVDKTQEGAGARLL